MRNKALFILCWLLGTSTGFYAQTGAHPGRPSKADKTGARGPILEPVAVSTSPLALPFKRTWQHLTDAALALQPTLDGSRIYLPLAGGRVFCLDRDSGALLWSSEPGGIISEPIVAGRSMVYIATRKLAADGGEAGASLVAVDQSTGLTKWAKDYPREFTSPIAVGGDRLYAGGADGAIYALDGADGSVVWKVATQDVVRGPAMTSPEAVIFGSNDGALRAVAPADGKLLWKVQTGGPVTGEPAGDERAVYFGSGDAYVYAVDRTTGKLRWRSRTGAAIEARPVLAGDRVLIGSFDNFVYALSRTTGDRLWKRRLENRITAPAIVEGDAAMIAPLHSGYVAVFLNADGRKVNLYKLDKECEIVAAPIFSGKTLILATSKGLVVATATRPPDNPANAIK